MRLQSEVRDVSSNITAKVKDFTIVANAKAFQVLTSNLYTDRPLAIVRELACNAIDAHYVAGIPQEPIRVLLPTQLSPTLRVIDRGPGMSEEKCMDLYTAVFASDKNSSNDAIGGFGLGSKSPFSYTDTFTVISKHGGWKKTYTAYIQETGTPGLVKVAEEPCSETGVEVVVPVKRNDFVTFRDAATRAFQYFDPLPNCPGLEMLKPTYVFQTPDFGLSDTRRGYNGYHQVIMGGVAYPLGFDSFPEDFRQTHRRLFSLAFQWDLFLPIGTCDLAPSREALSLDKQTIANLDKALTKVRNAIHTECQKGFDQCQTGLEAHIRAAQLDVAFDLLFEPSHFTWGAEKKNIPSTLGRCYEPEMGARVSYMERDSVTARGMVWNNYPSRFTKIPTFFWLDEPFYRTRTWYWFTKNRNAIRGKLPAVFIHAHDQETAARVVRDVYQYRPDVLVRASEAYPKTAADLVAAAPTPRKKTKLKQWRADGFHEVDVVLSELDPDTTLWAEMDGGAFKNVFIIEFLKLASTMDLLKDYTVLGVPRTLKRLDKKMPGQHLSEFMEDVRIAYCTLPSSIHKLQTYDIRHVHEFEGLLSDLRKIGREFQKRYPGRAWFSTAKLDSLYNDAAAGHKIGMLFARMFWEFPKYDSKGGSYRKELEALRDKYPMLPSLHDYDVKHPGFWHYFDLVHAAEES